MTYVPTETERTVHELMARVEAEMGREFAGELSDAQCRRLVEAEDAAVILHGKHILAAIEGRGFASTAGVSTYDDDSILVPLFERAEVAS